jgi:hypothetical protein
VRESFKLAWRAFLRGGGIASLIAVTFITYKLMPLLVRTDGTQQGAVEMFVRAVTGGVYIFLLISILCAAAGFFAQERVGNRLALSIVRPASSFSVVLGIWSAFLALTMSVLVLSGSLTAFSFRSNNPGVCHHHIRPILPPPEYAASKILDQFLKDPKTPEEIKKAPRATVLAFLASKEADRYEAIKKGGVLSWPFDLNVSENEKLFVRIRFSTAMELRAAVEGKFEFGPWSAVITNNTQAIIDVPLVFNKSAVDEKANDGKKELRFVNTGRETIMVRPRKDVEILVPADGFNMNLLRSSIIQFSIVALIAAFGLFLSSGLSRPVATFTALVAAAVIAMSPSVIDQYPNEFETTWTDRFGLAVSRTIEKATYWIESPNPIGDLAENKCVEWSEVATTAAACTGFSLVLLAMASFVLRRKPFVDRS